MAFDCEKCGSCCRVYGCKHLNADGSCSIYERRPLICNVDMVFETKGYAERMTRQEFYDLNKRLCKVWQAMQGGSI